MVERTPELAAWQVASGGGRRVPAFHGAHVVVVLAALGASMGTMPGQTEPFDLMLVGARVVDGTGNPWYYADVGIEGDRIVAVGQLEGATATRIVDATGKLIVPGFIDLHSHADDAGSGPTGLRSEDPWRRAAPNLVAQGITTVVVNQDGGSPPIPIAHQRAELETAGFGPNVILMVGHNTIRGMALGEDYRRGATAEEIDRMRELLRAGMEQGAYGLTAGLEYIPGRWSDTDELLALVSELKPFGGVYIVHERASGADPMWYVPSRDPPGPPTMLDNIIEAIEVAEQTRVPTVATHIKVRGADFWGSSGAIISLIERARARGVEIWADQYPYTTTGSDGNTVLIPDWVLEADRWEALLTTENSALERDIAREITRRGGAENIFIFEYPDADAVGKSLRQFAQERGVSFVEAAILLQLEGFPDRPGGARLRGFSLAELDVEAMMAQPWTVTASDAGIAVEGDGPVHARFYGTFPRKIREYAIERGIITVEHAVRSSTSLPAQILRLSDRGIIREGFRADIVILDEEALRDTATFIDPYQFPVGVDHVLINGQFVVEDGLVTGALPGVIITPPPRR